MSYRSTLLGFALISASLAVILIMSGCGEEEKDPVLTAKEGWAFYEAGKYESAKQKFEEALVIKPGMVDAYVGLGWTHGKMAELQECIASFQDALSEDPQNVDALAGIAFAYLADDKYDLAIANSRQALAVDPYYSFEHGNIASDDLHIVLAESYYYKGDFDEAAYQVEILTGRRPSVEELPEELERILGGPVV